MLPATRKTFSILTPMLPSYPSNTMTLLQPMDQWIIANFKRHYTKPMLRQTITATDLEESIILRDFWKKYNIYKVVQTSQWNRTKERA